ncbi:MAG: hypothetical protein JWL72_555 [Ilumatobacteraceae bacterium]|nr:hypothetical protein [Ilumatobacteraceae bacterium]
MSTTTRRTVLVSLVVIIGLVWWWLPTLRGDSSHTDVAVVGDSFLWSAERELTNRIHEDGFSLVWAPQQATWCDAPAAVSTVVHADHPAIVVVSFSGEGTCGSTPAVVRDQVAAAAGSARLIVVDNPAADPAAPPTQRASVVDAAQLLGPDGTLAQGCLWWDDCGPNGQIAVRDADDGLAASGQTRVARLIVAALR